MAIVTFEYYNETYLGETIAEEDFPRAEARSERIINQITHGRAANFAALPASQQEAIQEAICAQIEYLAINGSEITVNGESAGGWTVGKVRVDKGSGSGANARSAASMVCAAAIGILEQTGLLNPQVPTVGNPIILPYPWGCC